MKPEPVGMPQEIGRKAIHLSTGVLPLWIYWADPPWSWRGPLLAFLVVLGVDLVRITWAPFRTWIEPWIGSYLRVEEQERLISVHYLTFSAALLAFLAPAGIAAAALGYLVVGDAAAALVGRRFGRHRIGSKSLEGSVACLVCCIGIGLWLFPARPVAVGGGALVATLVELLPLPIDDNLGVPLFSASALTLLL